MKTSELEKKRQKLDAELDKIAKQLGIYTPLEPVPGMPGVLAMDATPNQLDYIQYIVDQIILEAKREVRLAVEAIPEMQAEDPGNWQRPNSGIMKRDAIRKAVKAELRKGAD